MGLFPTKQVEYAEWTGEEQPGETRILRHPVIVGKELLTEPIQGINTIWTAFENSVKNHPNRNCLGTRKYISKDKFGDYEWKTYNQIYEEARAFCAGLIALDLIPVVSTSFNGDFRFLGIYSKNREEWLVADLAGHLNSVTCVTFYDTLGENTIEYILQQTKLTTIVMESKSLKKIINLKKEGKQGCLHNLILLDVDDEEVVKQSEDLGYKVYKYPQIFEAGKGKQIEFNPAKPETIATLCYTSGTTGVPKGAMISHRGILSDTNLLNFVNIEVCETDVHLSYLPLAHVMERVVVTACLVKTVAVGFFSGNATKILDDAKLLKPTIFLGVPRIYQRVYDVVTSTSNKAGRIQKALFDRAVSTKLAAYRKNGYLTHSIWDRLIFNKTKNSLGGRVKLMITGSAPIDPPMLEFLKICFCCPILEGYGQTESCAAATCTRADDNTSGHVGGPVPACEIKLVDVEALNYTSKDVNEKGEYQPRGEVCIRGNILFSGYFNDKENTQAALDKDGWLHTGDVGTILPHLNSLKIIDRVKNIFKLSHGEYVAPEKLENVLIKSKYVAQIFVHGESIENFLVSVVIPKKEPIIDFLKTKGIEATKDNVKEYYNNPDLHKEILKDMETVGRKNDFKGFEVIKKVTLDEEPFTLENALLTPTMKLKRHEAKQKYLEQIKSMYANSTEA
jgi:long-chain acyl-CoA synthetase